MDEHDFLAEQFEEHRAHLRAVAYRDDAQPMDADVRHFGEDVDGRTSAS